MDPTFTELYRTHYPAVLRFVRRRAHEAEIDDVVSETFLAAWRHQDDLAAAPLPWLYRTARNVLRNTARTTGRREGLVVRIASLGEAGATVDDPISRLDTRREVVEAWQRLEPLDQEVLALQIWEGLDGREAAAVLGISRAACAMRATRARRRLAAALTASEPEPDPEPHRALPATTHPFPAQEARS